jgi:hypothetical protein
MARPMTSRRRWLARAALGCCLLSGAACGRVLGIRDLAPPADASKASDDPLPTADASDAGAREDEPTSTDIPDGSSSNEDAFSGAPGCTGDLSNVLMGDFTISFTLRTTQTDMVIALLNQRLLCTSGVFWEARIIGGHIYFEISDINAGTVYTLSQQNKVLIDGRPHGIVIGRRNQIVQITVDGSASAGIAAPQSLTQLPAVEVGASVCESVDTVKLQGQLSDICVARK